MMSDLVQSYYEARKKMHASLTEKKNSGKSWVRLFASLIIVAVLLPVAAIGSGTDLSTGTGTETGIITGIGEKAYIFIGDVNPPWYSVLIRSTLGEVDPYKDLQPVIDAQKKKLEDMGYTVTIQRVAIENDLKSVLQDPTTKAIAWFGHGDEGEPGTIYTSADQTINPNDIGDWAREQLRREIGEPNSWKSLSVAERNQLYERWNEAHFNLKYAYFHTCYGMDNNKLIDVLMDDNGEFHGYKGTAGLSDTSEKATTIRGKPMHKTSGTGPATETGTGTGVGVGKSEASNDPCSAGQCVSFSGKCYSEGLHEMADGSWECSHGEWRKAEGTYEHEQGANSGQATAQSEPDVDISGRWSSSIGFVYDIRQSGNSFTWQVITPISEQGQGTIIGKNQVNAEWNGENGSGSASGTVEYSGNGIGRISWSNGVTFTRE